MISRIWAVVGRRKVPWIIGTLLLAVGIGMAVAYLISRSGYERFASASPCETASMPSQDGCYSDLPGQVVSASETSHGAHSAPSGEIDVKLAGGQYSLEPVNGEDATRFAAGDPIKARVWRSQIVSLTSANGKSVDLRDSPASNNAASGGLALAGIGAGGTILGFLAITGRKSR